MKIRLALVFGLLLAVASGIVRAQLVMRPAVHCQCDCFYDDGYLRCDCWCTD